MKKKNLIITCIFFIFFFITMFLSLDKNKIYSTRDYVGQQLADVDLEYFNKNSIFNTKKISNYNFTLINFWASWCGPCRKEHKNLMALSENKNLKIIGINFRDKQNNAKEFLKEMGNPFFILTKDTDGKKSVNFGVYGIPETILVNQDLQILKKYIGPLSLKDVREINKIVKK